MISNKDVLIALEKSDKKTYSEFVGELFKDKDVEIYLGETYETIVREQSQMDYPTVICGTVIGGHSDCLIINAFYSVKESTKSLLFINSEAIMALKEISENNLEDYLMHAKHGKNFRKR